MNRWTAAAHLCREPAPKKEFVQPIPSIHASQITTITYCTDPSRGGRRSRLLAGLSEPFSPTLVPMIQYRNAFLHVMLVL